MIFNLFKSKPTLKELIPKGFVDIHSHILPGIDDGAKDIHESLKLIEKMKNIGFSKIIGTPHTYPGIYNNTNESIKKSFEILQNKLFDKHIISYASEYMLDLSLIEMSDKRTLLCLNDNYVLIEMSFISEPIYLHEIIFSLIKNGYKPIIAHPERYPFYYTEKSKYFKLKDLGCFYQLNFNSVIGKYGLNNLEISNFLIKNNLIDFIASDTHNINHINNTQNKVLVKEIDKLKNIFENYKVFR